MVVSPVITEHVGDDVKITGPKVKALAVRTNSITKKPAEAGHSFQSRGSELAEQLNEETKQKYVKGTPDSSQFSPNGFF